MAGYGAAIFAVACIFSLVARAVERWPRYLKPAVDLLWMAPLLLMLAPFGLFVRAARWAGNRQVRQIVVFVGTLVAILMVGLVFDLFDH